LKRLDCFNGVIVAVVADFARTARGQKDTRDAAAAFFIQPAIRFSLFTRVYWRSAIQAHNVLNKHAAAQLEHINYGAVSLACARWLKFSSSLPFVYFFLSINAIALG